MTSRIKAKPKVVCSTRPKITSTKVAPHIKKTAAVIKTKKVRPAPKPGYTLYPSEIPSGGVLNQCADLTEKMSAIRKDIERSSVSRARVIQNGQLSDVSTSVGASVSSSPPRLNLTPLVIPTAPPVQTPPDSLYPNGPLNLLPSNNGVHKFPVTMEMNPKTPFNRRLVSSTPDPEKAASMSTSKERKSAPSAKIKAKSKLKENLIPKVSQDGNHGIRKNLLVHRNKVSHNCGKGGLEKFLNNLNNNVGGHAQQVRNERLQELLIKSIESSPQGGFVPDEKGLTEFTHPSKLHVSREVSGLDSGHGVVSEVCNLNLKANNSQIVSTKEERFVDDISEGTSSVKSCEQIDLPRRARLESFASGTCQNSVMCQAKVSSEAATCGSLADGPDVSSQNPEDRDLVTAKIVADVGSNGENSAQEQSRRCGVEVRSSSSESSFGSSRRVAELAAESRELSPKICVKADGLVKDMKYSWEYPASYNVQLRENVVSRINDGTNGPIDPSKVNVPRNASLRDSNATPMRDSGIGDIHSPAMMKIMKSSVDEVADFSPKTANDMANQSVRGTSDPLPYHTRDNTERPNADFLDRVLLMSQLREECDTSAKLKDTVRDLQIQLDVIKSDRHQLLLTVTEKDSAVARCKQDHEQTSRRLNKTIDGLRHEVAALTRQQENVERENHILGVSLTERDKEIARMSEFLQEIRTNVSDIVRNIERAGDGNHGNCTLSAHLPSLRRILKGDYPCQSKFANTSDILSVSKQHESDDVPKLTQTNVARHNSATSFIARILEEEPIKQSYDNSRRTVDAKTFGDNIHQKSYVWNRAAADNDGSVTSDDVRKVCDEIPQFCSSDNDCDLTLTDSTLQDDVKNDAAKKVQFEGVIPANQSRQRDTASETGNASRYSVTDYFRKYPPESKSNDAIDSSKGRPDVLETSNNQNYIHPNFQKVDSSKLNHADPNFQKENSSNLNYIDPNLPKKNSGKMEIDPDFRRANSISDLENMSSNTTMENKFYGKLGKLGMIENNLGDDKSTTSGVTISSVSTLNSIDEENFRLNLASLDEQILHIKQSLARSKDFWNLGNNII